MAGKIIEEGLISEIVRLYKVERIGHKRIAARIGVSDATARKYLKRAGVYQPGTIPRHTWGEVNVKRMVARIAAGIPLKAKVKSVDQYQAEAWRAEWKGKFPDWSNEWYKFQASKRSLSKYQALSTSDRKIRNQRCVLIRMSRPNWMSSDAIKERREYSIRWKSDNPARVKAYLRKTRDRPEFKIRENCRRRIRDHLRSASESFADSLGCSARQLKAWLESQFTRGMSWDNYGSYWHVDHIQPLASFDLSNPTQRKLACNWANLRPLEARKNQAKSDSIEIPQLHLCLSM